MHYIPWFDGSYKNHKIGIKQIKVHSTWYQSLNRNILLSNDKMIIQVTKS